MNIALRLGVYNTQILPLKSFYFTYLIFVYIKMYWKGLLILFLHTKEPSMFSGNECREQFKMWSVSLAMVTTPFRVGRNILNKKKNSLHPPPCTLEYTVNLKKFNSCLCSSYCIDYLYCFTLTFIISEIAGKISQKWDMLLALLIKWHSVKQF